MAKYLMLALGCFLAITGSSLALKIDELTDADLIKILEFLEKNSDKEGEKVTCENYESRCKALNLPKYEKVCLTMMKMYTCENLNDAQGFKQIWKALERVDPELVAELLQKY